MQKYKALGLCCGCLLQGPALFHLLLKPSFNPDPIFYFFQVITPEFTWFTLSYPCIQHTMGIRTICCRLSSRRPGTHHEAETPFELRIFLSPLPKCRHYLMIPDSWLGLWFHPSVCFFKRGRVSGWRHGLVVKSTDCSSRGPEFNSQQLHSGSQPSVIGSDALF